MAATTLNPRLSDDFDVFLASQRVIKAVQSNLHRRPPIGFASSARQMSKALVKDWNAWKRPWIAFLSTDGRSAGRRRPNYPINSCLALFLFLVLFHYRSGRDFLGPLSVPARFLSLLFDVLVLALLFAAGAPQVLSLGHRQPP
jgi:hypothetical protein